MGDEIRLQANGRFEPGPVRATLAAHAVPGGQRFDPTTGVYTRLLFPGGERGQDPIPISLRLDETGVVARLPTADREVREAVTRLLRFWFDLDTDLSPVVRHLGADPRLTGPVAERPGLRVTRSPDGFEATVGTVLGQQVSLARGRTLGARLLELCGGPGPAGLTVFPSPERLAGEPFERLRSTIGLTRSRARTVLAVAGLFADGFGFSPEADPAEIRSRLLEIPGVGPWTVDYLAVRAVGDPDAFPAGDAVLRRALGRIPEPRVAGLAARWTPFRSYAAVHLWAATVYGAPAADSPPAACG